MGALETDYLVIGAGAVGLAFADTLLDHSDAHITIVDRHGKPGGHWNDAYAFVTLHQPSAFYGVASMHLGSGRKDTHGVNDGLYELATGHEVSGYFDRVMHQRLLASGRVTYLPMTEFADGACRSLLSGETRPVTVRRKTVDATYYATSIPSTHTPKFAVAPGVRVVPPNALVDLWREPKPPEHFAILGAGKTAMDVGVWLLGSGVPADKISWVVPRDSWLLNRRTTQPGMEFFTDVFGAQLAQMEALAAARDAADLFARFEAAGVVLRIDQTRTPEMFHFATISTGEVDVLRQIKTVIRKGRVTALTPTTMTLRDGDVAMAPGTLYVDCTATAVERRPLLPIFAGDRITLQMVRVPQPAFSAALCAFIEATVADDASKNALCRPIPLPDRIEDYPATSLVNMSNQAAWGRTAAVREWIISCRLDGFGRMVAAAMTGPAEHRDILARLSGAARGAVVNIAKLTGKADMSA